MGRLPAGQKPMPVSQRLAKYRQELEAAGGRRVIVDLGPEAASALSEVQAAHSDCSIKDAISKALVAEAKRARRRVA